MPSSSRAVRWGWSLTLLAGLAAAQAPVVPADHYGPPTCPGAQMPLHRPSVSAAEAEQKNGEMQSSLGSTRTLPSDEPMENFGIERYRLADYADCVGDSGCYWADLDAQYKRAEQALEDEAAHLKPDEKPAVVMDIDETTLSGYCEMKREDFGYIPSMFDRWIVSPEAAIAIPGAKRFFNEAKAKHVAVFFITGRPGIPDSSHPHHAVDQTVATERNLKAAGFGGWAGLALRNGGENLMPTIAYKSHERQRIVDKGYTILVSVGDQWSDLEGEPQAEVSVKLPNPFYFLP